jgi:hypothetical protein
METKNIYLLFILILITIFIVSCSKDQPTAPSQPTNNSPQARFSDIAAKVFVNCTDPQCHSSAGNQGNLVLQSSVAYSNLVNVQSVLFPAFKRVEPFNSANSLIIKILRGEVSPRMPLSRNPLPAETIDSIAKWIDLGALNN